MSEGLACQQATNPTLIFQISVPEAAFMGKNESQCQYRHGHTLTHTLIPCPYLVAHGKRNAYHMKIFYFYSEAWARWQVLSLSYFLVQLLLSVVAVLSLLFSLNCSPHSTWPALLFLHCWTWKDLWQSLQSLAVRIACYPVVHTVLGNATVECLFV